MDIMIIVLIILFVILYIYNIKYKRKIYQDPLIKKIKYDVSKLDSRIANIDFFSSDESYTEDKNKIFLCLKDEKGEYYNYNMLMYVAIHECSHALTDVIDVEHITPEFRGMFESLLQKASKLGLYDSTTPLEDHYCGIDLDINDMQR
jgi:hypothetical protein